MKFATLLVLPALALSAAVPAPIQERQLPGLPLDPTCLLQITGITACVPGGVRPGTVLRDLLGCPLNVILAALDCVIAGLPLPGLPPLPVPIPVKE